MLSEINEETIVPEKADATVADDVEEVEEVEADATDTDTDETDDGEDRDESEDEDKPSESSTEKDGVEKRIDEITAKYRQEERARIELENRYRQAEERLQKYERVEPVEPGKTLADFDYDEGQYREYVHKVARQEAFQEAQQRIQHEQATKRQVAFQAKEAEFARNTPDYYKVAHYAPISPQVAEAIMGSDKGPELAFYLGKNPDVAQTISNMGPYDMARELGHIEATKLVEKKAPVKSSAPKPVPKIAATSSKVTVDPAKMTDAQFAAWRRKQIANR